MKNKLKLYPEATTKVGYTHLLAALLLSLENVLKLLYTILVFAVVLLVEVLSVEVLLVEVLLVGVLSEVDHEVGDLVKCKIQIMFAHFKKWTKNYRVRHFNNKHIQVHRNHASSRIQSKLDCSIHTSSRWIARM